MKNLLFIYNPHSGKGIVKEYLSDIFDFFVKNDYKISVYPTQERLDAREYIINNAMVH